MLQKVAIPDLDRIKEFVFRHESFKAEIFKEIRSVRGQEASPVRSAALQMLYSLMAPRDIYAGWMSEYREYGGGYSFSSLINELIMLKSALKDIGVLNLARGGNLKDRDRSFANNFGIPTSANYGDNHRLEKVPIMVGTVIKPYRGSNSDGVFLVDKNSLLQSFKSGKKYSSLHDGVEAEVLKFGRNISFDRWVVEQAVIDDAGRSARDLKVYAFYGECGLFQEIARPPGEGGNDVLKCAYDAAGNRVQLSGRCKELSGLGVPEQARDYSNRISLATPVPFLRIDFLRGSNGLYLGEITPHPGPIYKGGDITPELDVVLGKMYIEAEARLFKDLLQGKSFDTYREIYEATW